MPQFASRALHAIAHRSGLHHLSRIAQRRRLLIVCYHGLREDADPERHWLLLPRTQFAAQIEHLAANYDCLPIDMGLERLWANALDRPTACITFDDGYRNNLTIGLPILRTHGVPATIYLATSLIGTRELLWTTGIELAIAASTASAIDLPALELATQTLGAPDERRRLGKRIVEALKLRPVAERRRIASDVHRQLGGHASDTRRRAYELLDWSEVDTLAASGLVTFGGHTAHHEIVSRLDDDTLAHEIRDSIDAVRTRVPQATSATFAYPNGRPEDVDARAAAVLARVGCSAAVTTSEGLNTPDTPRMLLRRAVIGGDATMSGFIAQASAVRALVGR